MSLHWTEVPVDIDRFVRNAVARAARTLPKGTTMVLLLEGNGGGVWTVRRTGRRAIIEQKEHCEADCRVRCSVLDFISVVEGALDGIRGFSEGRVHLEGDAGLALRMHAALNRAVGYRVGAVAGRPEDE